MKEPQRVLKGLVDLCKKDGVVHILVEDMMLMNYYPAPSDGPRFWLDGVCACFTNTGTEPLKGRQLFTDLKKLLPAARTQSDKVL